MTSPRSRPSTTRPPRWRAALPLALSAATGLSLLCATSASAAAQPARFGKDGFFQPGNLLVSQTTYASRASAIVPGVTVLPPGCTSGCALASAGAAYPQVWNNDLVDPSFGVTSRVFLDQLTPSDRLLSTLPVPDGSRPGGGGLVTSFSSKSELALNLSTSGRYVTFMGYDQGADPNKLVAITDSLAALTPPAETFTTLRTAGFG